jgi:queuine tRNA-ribosyltransferase
VLPALRTQSAAFLTGHPFDGFAIGGLAVGEARELLYDITAHTAKLLPADRPRYLMGVGTPIDLIEAVNAGVDMFDCIIPGKMAQQAYAYTFEGQLRLSRTEFRLADAPLDPTCGCPTCRTYTRGYLRHLAQGSHHLSSRLLTVHNLWHYRALMKRMRTAIVEGRWAQEYRTLKDALAPRTSVPRPVDGGRRGDFTLVTLKSGARAVQHVGHGEVMHPVGPWDEANRLYVEQVHLGKRLSTRTQEPFRILDIGLGAAANAAAALSCAAALGNQLVRPMEIVSLELDLAPLTLALEDLGGFSFLAPWRAACEALVRDGSWEGQGVS